MFTIYAPKAIADITRAFWLQSRRRFMFGSCLFWLVLWPLASTLKLVVYLAIVVLILIAQLGTWIVDPILWPFKSKKAPFDQDHPQA